MPMDPNLAKIYGTNQPDEADLEKLAAAELANNLAATNEVDLSSLTEADLESLAAEVLGPQQEQDSQEKVAEADYLGRVMAHSYVAELREIEKTAVVASTTKGKVLQGLGHLEHKGRKVTDRIGRAAASAGKAVGRGAKHVGRFAMRHRGKAAIVGAAGAAGAAAHKMTKKSSALETLIEQRACEILEESGINPETFEAQAPTPASEKVASTGTPYDVLADVVEQQAWELLAQHGFQPAQ